VSEADHASAGPGSTDATDGESWLTAGVLSVGPASFFSDSGHEIATSLVPGLLTSVLCGSAAALGIIEGSSDAGMGMMKLLAGPWANDTVRRRRWGDGRMSRHRGGHRGLSATAWRRQCGRRGVAGPGLAAVRLVMPLDGWCCRWRRRGCWWRRAGEHLHERFVGTDRRHGVRAAPMTAHYGDDRGMTPPPGFARNRPGWADGLCAVRALQRVLPMIALRSPSGPVGLAGRPPKCPAGLPDRARRGGGWSRLERFVSADRPAL
jgi:hypothetical protein